MALSTAEKVALVYRGIENADYDNSLGREAIQRSDDFYFGRLPPPAADGRSQSVSMDVQDSITATLSSIMSSVTSEAHHRFMPQGDGDDVAAEVESKAVNDQIQDADGYIVKMGAIESCLRYTNGCIRAWIDNQPETKTQRLINATKSDAAALVASFPDEFNPRMEKLKDTGGENIEGWLVTIDKPSSKLRLEAVDLARIRLRKDWPSISLEGIDFFSIEHEDSRDALKKMGFPAGVVDDLPTDRDNFTEGAVRSKLQGEENSYVSAISPETELITWYECWVLIEGELMRVAVSNRTLLDETPATMIPAVLGAAYPQQTRWQGISLASKLESIQISKSEARRQYEDNLSTGNLSRTVGYDVELDDVLSGRTNGHIRGRSPNFRLEPVPVQDLTAGSLAYLQYMDQVRSEAGGAALDMESGENQALDKQIGAVASQQTLMNQELRSEFIARNISNTLLRPLMFIVHRLLREEFNGQITVRMQDQFQQVDPSTWQPRTLLTEPSGLSPSQRNRESANLTTVLQIQQQLMQSGLPLVDANSVHSAVQAWGYSVRLPINQYFIDPGSPTGQQMAQQQQQSSEQQQQMAMQVEQLPAMIEKLKQDQETARNTQDNEVKLKIAGIQAELDEAKLVLDGIENERSRETEQLTNGADDNGG